MHEATLITSFQKIDEKGEINKDILTVPKNKRTLLLEHFEVLSRQHYQHAVYDSKMAGVVN